MKIPSWSFLVVSIFLFALKVSIYKVLNNWKPVTFNTCNVLCAAQTVALISTTIFLRKDLSLETVKAIPRKTWFWMFLGSTLSYVLGNFLSLSGWETASVTNITVLQKCQSVILICAEPIFSCCKKLPSRWDAANAVLTAVGIVLTLVSPALFFGGMVGISEGEVYIILASMCYTGSLLISKKFLGDVPPGILTIFRLTLGTLSFHVIKLAQEKDMYQTLWTGELWLHMLYYGLFFVTVPQVFWLHATNECSKPLLSTGLNSQFVVQILLGMIILQSFPEKAAYVGGSFILLSVISAIVKENYKTTVEDGDDGDDKETSYQQLDDVALIDANVELKEND
jgi:drug/metabolite transporter (DMT)-like permease